MDLYQHDSADRFRFVVQGELTGGGVQQLRWAWQTARSILDCKQLVVDVSKVDKIDTPGIELLSLMRDSGARLVVERPTQCQEVRLLLNLPVTDLEDDPPGGHWARRVLNAFRLWA